MPRFVRRALTATLLAAVLVPAGTPLVAAAPPSAERVRTVVYPGDGLAVHLGQERRLGATSRNFQEFVHARLLHLWKLAGGKPKCRLAPTLVVKSWRADGFARAGEGIYAPCPGGGYDQIYVRKDGAWTAPRYLGSQEARSCSLLRWLGIPLPVADRACYQDFGELIKYRTYELPDDYSTARYAARVVAASVQDETGVGDAWASGNVLSRLQHFRDDGAKFFTIQRCFRRGDAQYGAYMGDARRACRLDVGDRTHTDIVVVRLHPARFGRWTTSSLRLV
jgi:hypothetical protein